MSDVGISTDNWFVHVTPLMVSEMYKLRSNSTKITVWGYSQQCNSNRRNGPGHTSGLKATTGAGVFDLVYIRCLLHISHQYAVIY